MFSHQEGDEGCGGGGVGREVGGGCRPPFRYPMTVLASRVYFGIHDHFDIHGHFGIHGHFLVSMAIFGIHGHIGFS